MIIIKKVELLLRYLWGAMCKKIRKILRFIKTSYLFNGVINSWRFNYNIVDDLII